MAAADLPPVDFVKHFDEQIAAKEQEIEETRKFEEDARSYLGSDQIGTSRAVAMERERDGLMAGRQRFVEADELRDATRDAEQGHPLALVGKVAEYPPLGFLMGEGAGRLIGGLGSLALGLGRQSGRAAAGNAAAAKPAMAPSPVEQCPVDTPPVSPPEPILLSKRRFGHTFERHGQNATEFATRRAQAMGRPNGQFLDDQAAGRFIVDNLDKLKNGAVSIPIPPGLPARIVNPDGTFSPATSVRLVPSSTGVSSAYPE